MGNMEKSIMDSFVVGSLACGDSGAGHRIRYGNQIGRVCVHPFSPLHILIVLSQWYVSFPPARIDIDPSPADHALALLFVGHEWTSAILSSSQWFITWRATRSLRITLTKQNIAFDIFREGASEIVCHESTLRRP